MKVKALKGFSAFVGDEMVCVSEGQMVELPKGADWVRAGLAVAVEDDETPAAVVKPAPESTSVESSEKAVTGKPRRRVMGSKTLRGN